MMLTAERGDVGGVLAIFERQPSKQEVKAHEHTRSRTIQ